MSATLIIGCFFLAFGPLLSLFACVVYPKAQLVILVTTFALVFILSATAASIVYSILHAIFQFETPSDSMENALESTFSWTDGALAAIIPSVLFQFLGRCLGTSLYHTVERVIAASLQQHQEEERLKNRGNNTNNTTSDAALLKLALNDGAAGVAAAVGFGGMHAILLYGTLLSSEAVNNSSGILYQDSCPNIPSLVHSALLTNFFSILQVFWMLLTFFGMRRRLLFHRGEQAEEEEAYHPRRALWSNSRTGGNYALLFTLLSHALVAGITLFNRQPNGCRITLPVVGGMVLVTAYIFFIGCGRIYMPPPLIPEVAIAGDVMTE